MYKLWQTYVDMKCQQIS